MDIRKRKLKGYFVLSVLIIVCLIMASMAAFIALENTAKDYSNNIMPLAGETRPINTPTIQYGREVYYSGSSNIDPISYTQMTSQGSFLSTATKNAKELYLDFSTKVVVPAYTKYTITYTISFSIKKNASGGDAWVCANLYDYGINYTDDSSAADKKNAASLGNLQFGSSGGNSYYKKQVTTNNSSTITGTYTYSTVHKNKTDSNKAFYHNYGYFGYITSATSYTSSMSRSVSVSASITAVGIGQDSPENVEAEYTGQGLSITNVESSQRGWYDENIMSPDYSANADMINVGEKTVKFTLITADEEDFFRGDYDESIGESERIRYITFLIKKKKISASVAKSDDGNSCVATAITGEVFSGDTEGNGRAPEFAINYVSTDGKGYDSDIYPTDKVGKYKAVAKITNDCPYELDETKEEEYTYTFEITKTEVIKPTKPLGNLTYNGQDQEFVLGNIDDIDKVTITPKSNGITDIVDGKVKVKNAGKYIITISLKDHGYITKWENTTDDIASYDLELEMDKAPFTVTFDDPEGGWSWNSDTIQTISFTDNRQANDTLIFKADVDGTSLSVSAGEDPKTSSVTIPKLPSKTEKYTLTVKLDTNSEVSKNYNFTSATHTFNITDKDINVEDKNVIWSYYDNGKQVTLNLEQWSPSTSTTYEITYSGQEYEFSVKTDGLDPDDEVVVQSLTASSGKNAGNYTTIVTLSSSHGKLTKSTFTLNWKINKKMFDLSQVKWNYTDPIEFDGDFHEVHLLNLPTGLKATYGGDFQNIRRVKIDSITQEVKPYNATVTLQFDTNALTDVDKNYIRPTKPVAGQEKNYIYDVNDEEGNAKEFPWSLDWIIKKKTLDLEEEWVGEVYNDENDLPYFSYKIEKADTEAKIEYEYYAYGDYVDGAVVEGKTPITRNQIIVNLEGEPVYYWVVAKLKSAYANDYEIKEGTQYRDFKVGLIGSLIKIDMDKSFLYDGKAHGGEDDWKFPDEEYEMGKEYIQAEYYSIETVDGNEVRTLLDGAPTKSGKYIVKLSIVKEQEDKYMLNKARITYEITKVQVEVSDGNKTYTYDGTIRSGEIKVTSDNYDLKNIKRTYYEGEEIKEDGSNKLADGELPKNVGKYLVVLTVADSDKDNYEVSEDCDRFVIEITQAEIEISQSAKEYVYDGTKRGGEFDVTSKNYDADKLVKTYYKGNEVDESKKLKDGEVPQDVGEYIVVLSIKDDDKDNYIFKKGQKTEFSINITPAQITAVWDTDGDIPTLKGISEEDLEKIEYVFTDEEGITYKQSELEVGKVYKVKAVIKDDYEDNYVFVDKKGVVLEELTVTDEQTFKMREEPKQDEPITPVDPETPGEQPPASSFDISKIGEVFKEYWQLIASVISILLMLIFISKTIGYENKRKQNKKTIEKKYSTFYAITLFGLTTTTWTLIACVLMAGTVLTFIIMLAAKSKYKKSNEEVEDAKEEYERNQKDLDNRKRVEENQRRDEQMQMMFMGMMGGNSNGGGGQQGYVYQQPMVGLGADEIRGIVADTMSNMLPNVTQYLPQEASYNDELIQQLIDQNAQNEEQIRQLTEQNEQMMERLMDKIEEQPQNNVGEEIIERLVDKLSKQQAYERQAEKEVASANVNDEIIKSLIEGQKAIMEKLAQQDAEKKAEAEKAEKEENAEIIKKLVEGQDMLMRKLSEKPVEAMPSSKLAEIDRNTDKIEMLVRNQERLMERVIEMSAKNSDKSNERLMEKMIELSVKADNRQPERIIEKPVEKIVEKEVKVEVPVEKVVPMPVDKPAPKTKEVAPRLTLDEAYAKMSASQKKIFDTLKNYALTKDKCKENKSTYFTVLGQSSVNPLVKLTIKKNTTVALFKMEDEYMKDIRRGASSDGTKVKVKETEVVVGDNQALATAKIMIDLREDQIERYNDYLKEQKSMRKK